MNGGFENVGPGWTPTADSYLFTYGTEVVYGGERALYLGFPPSFAVPAVMAVEQRISLPSARLTLLFYYVLRRTGQMTAGHRAEMLLIDAATGDILTRMDLAAAGSDRWTLARQELDALGGRTVLLVFRLENDGQFGQLDLIVDEVSLLACGAGAAPRIMDTPERIGESGMSAPGADPLGVALPAMPTLGAPIAEMATVGLPECDCSEPRYQCSDFAVWSAAQACYTLCRVSTGRDLHGLDPDGNGIACELELPDLTAQTTVRDLFATPLDPTTPTPVADTTPTVEPTAPATTPTPATLASDLPTNTTLPLQILTVLVFFAVGVLVVAGVIALILHRMSR